MENVTENRRPGLLRRILIGRNPKLTFLRSLFWVAILLVVFKLILLPIKVSGISMSPTYSTNGVNFVNRLAYLFREPQRGDIVAIRTTGFHVMFMKRIVGLPGETVSFHDGKLFINGKEKFEPYEQGLECDWEDDGKDTPKTLGPDEYFYVGDNRSMATENHTHGKTGRDRIVGKILLWKNLFASR